HNPASLNRCVTDRTPDSIPLIPATPYVQSPLAPPLPIPNRSVKRRHADDSTELPCESRSSSGTPSPPPAHLAWAGGIPGFPILPHALTGHLPCKSLTVDKAYICTSHSTCI